MRIKFNRDHLLLKSLFTKKLPWEEVSSITVTDTEGTTVQTKSGQLYRSKKDSIICFLYPELTDILVRYGILYDDQSQYAGNNKRSYSAREVRALGEQAKEIAYPCISARIRQYFGAEYDVDLRIHEALDGAALEFRIVKDGCVLEDFPGYEEIDEEGLVKAMDSMDMSFLFHWDPYSGEGSYLIVDELTEKEKLEEYLIEGVFHYFIRKYENSGMDTSKK